jgi:anti-sigma factor RsiW
VIDLGGSCNRHRPLLVDFVDHGEVRPGTAAALAHLDRCARCLAAIESTMLTITALRRLGDAAIEAEPRPDAWPRLRTRIEGLRPRRPAVMSPLAGLALSFAIVAVVVVPFRFGGGTLERGAATPLGQSAPINLADRRIENAYIAAVRHVSSSTAGAAEVDDKSAAFNRIYPDDIRPQRKEVGPAATTTRPSEAS